MSYQYVLHGIAADKRKVNMGKEHLKTILPCVKALLTTFHYFIYSLQHLGWILFQIIYREQLMFTKSNLPIVMKVVNVRAESQLVFDSKPMHIPAPGSQFNRERCTYT